MPSQPPQLAAAQLEGFRRAWLFAHDGDNSSRMSAYWHSADDMATYSFQKAYVCRRARVVYVDVFKAASSAVDAFLEAHCDHVECATPFRHLMCFKGKDACPVTSPMTWLGNRSWFTFSMVRDPVERFISGVHELKARRKIPPSTPVHHVIDLVRANGWHDPHMQPQRSFLSFRAGRSERPVKIPLQFIGSVDQMEPTLDFLRRTFFPAPGPSDGQSAASSDGQRSTTTYLKNVRGNSSSEAERLTADELDRLCVILEQDFRQLHLPLKHCSASFARFQQRYAVLRSEDVRDVR